MNHIAEHDIEQALQRILSVTEHPRALAIKPQDRAALHQAVQRVRAQLLGQADAVLTIALAGCTGAGKSTLINALAGARIAVTSDRRPCTTRTRVYHHREVPCGGLPDDLAEQATFVGHDRPELRQKVIVDTPDLDTYYTEHRAATRALLKAAGLVIYVFSPERYLEERAWSVIREEQRFSSCLAVVNKSDTLAPDALQRITAEIRQRFAEMGKPDIPVLCIAAGSHVPATRAGDGPEALPAAEPPARKPAVTLDEFLTLRAFIEHELQAGDIARMIRQQRARVIDHLQGVVDTVIPARAEESLDELAGAGDERARDTANDLTTRLHDRLSAIEADLYPLVIVRKHQRFWGPFHTWLAVADFLRYGLPRLIRQLRLLTLPGGESATGRLLPAGNEDLVADRLRQQSQQIQSLLFEKGLPVERWRTITAGVDAGQMLAGVARSIEDRYETLAASAYRRGAAFPWIISFIAWLMPAALIVFTAYNIVRQYTHGLPAPMDLLWDFLGGLVLAYLLLHMLTGVVSSGRALLPRKGVAAESLEQAIRQTFGGWVAAYRGDLEADLADLREPIVVLRSAAEGGILREEVAAGTEVAAPCEPAETPLPCPAEAVQPGEAEAEADSPPASPADLLRESMRSAGKSGRRDGAET